MTTRLATTLAQPRPALVSFLIARDGDSGADFDALVDGGANAITSEAKQ